MGYDHAIYLCAKSFNVFSFNIAFLVIGVVLYTGNESSYTTIIAAETA
jgi:hypothetical protein